MALVTAWNRIEARGWLVGNGFCLLLSLCLLSQGCVRKDPPAKKGEFGGGGGVPITAATVVRKDVPVEIQVVGNVEAYLTISVKAQVSGELTRVLFREGDYVKKDDPLFTIDPRQLEAQLNQVQANLARDEAQLGLLDANLARDRAQEKYAQAEVARYNSLLEHALISKEQAEQVRTSAEAASAGVRADEAALRSARATVAATRATVENIKVQFGYTSIRSPINGRTGNLNVKQGNVVNANSMDMMTINQVEPIYVTFSVPESRLRDIRKGQLVMASAQTDSSSPETGEISFIDNAVDMTTGTIRAKGTFANKEKRLWPGEFVRVTIRLSMQPDALTVPNQAVQTGQEGSYVFVVKEDRTVEMRSVIAGARVDQDLVIEKGLRPGERVVTEGQLRLAPGMRVQIQNAAGGPPAGRPSKGGPRTKTGNEP
jgi:membrane fusion protein, multidrug efflux system